MELEAATSAFARGSSSSPTRFGIAAADLAAAGGWGRMVARKAQEVEDVPLAEALAQRNLLPPELYHEAEVFFG